MTRRIFSPHSRQFNERMIERTQGRYNGGLSRDIEDLGPSSLAELVNGRAMREAIEGRAGCELVTPADWGVTIVDSAETLSAAMQSGAMYAASGRGKEANTVPAAGSKFTVYGSGDLVGNDLEAAKGSPPRAYDVFEVDDSGSGTESVSYLGSVRLPALTGYGDTTSNELVASKSGTTITVTSGTLTQSHVDQYWDWGDGIDLIKSVDTGANTCETENSGVRAATSSCRIMGRVNASLYHQSQNKLVLLIGRKLYVANGVPWYSFTEVCREGSCYEPADAFCKMYEDDTSIILVSGTGFYRIKIDDSENYRYWRINDSSMSSSSRPSDVQKEAGRFWERPKKYPYRYIIKYARIRNTDDNAFADRYDPASIIEWESGSAKADATGKDYVEIAVEKPVGPSTTAGAISTAADGLRFASRVIGGYLGTTHADYDAVAQWQPITDGTLKIQLTIYESETDSNDIVADTPEMDFSGATSMEDVAEIIQSGINRTLIEYGVSLTVTLDRNTTGERFVVESGPGVIITDINDAPSTGTSIASFMEIATASVETFEYYNGIQVGLLTLESDVCAATHYSLFRTKVLDKDGIDAGNDPNLFVHVADIPLVRPVFVTGTSGVINAQVGEIPLSAGVGEATDEYGDNYTITPKYLGSDSATMSPSTASYVQNTALAIGGGSAFVASVSGSTMTISRGSIALTDLDVGKPVWFATGELRWIKSVTSAYVAELTKSGSISETACGMNPIPRGGADTVLDEIQGTFTNAITPRVRSYALPSRFTQELPNCDIGKVVPGWVFGATQGDNKYYYSDSSKSYLAGSYAPDLQFNDKIDGAIQEFLYHTDYLGVRTEFGTWRVNLATVNELGNADVGENIDGFNDPEIADNSVGSEGEGGTAILENGNFLTFTSEPSVREFNMFTYGPNLAHEMIQESDIQELEAHTIMLYDHILGLILWGTK